MSNNGTCSFKTAGCRKVILGDEQTNANTGLSQLCESKEPVMTKNNRTVESYIGPQRAGAEPILANVPEVIEDSAGSPQ